MQLQCSPKTPSSLPQGAEWTYRSGRQMPLALSLASALGMSGSCNFHAPPPLCVSPLSGYKAGMPSSHALPLTLSLPSRSIETVKSSTTSASAIVRFRSTAISHILTTACAVSAPPRFKQKLTPLSTWPQALNIPHTKYPDNGVSLID